MLQQASARPQRIGLPTFGPRWLRNILTDKVAASQLVFESIPAAAAAGDAIILRPATGAVVLQEHNVDSLQARVRFRQAVALQVIILVPAEADAGVDHLEDAAEDARQVGCVHHVDVLPWGALGDHLQQLHVEVRPACALRADADRVDRVGLRVQGRYGGDGVVTARGNVRGIRPRVGPVPAVG